MVEGAKRGRGVERVKMRCVLEGRVRHGVWREESCTMLRWCLRMCGIRHGMHG